MDRLLQRASRPVWLVIAALSIGLGGCAAPSSPVASLAAASPASPVPATPVASASPRLTLSPLASPPLGSVPAGRYAWRWPRGHITFDVPDGWTGLDDGTVSTDRDTPAEIGFVYWLPATLTAVTQLYDDACSADGALVSVGPTSADLVAALDAQVGTSATVTDVSIGGQPGFRIELVPEPGLDMATCRMGADGPLQIWKQDGAGYLAMFPAPDGTYGRAVVWALDVDGDRLVFSTTSNGASSPRAIAEIEAMVASMAFE